MVEGAHQIIKRPNTPFYNKGYYSADFFGGTFPAITSDKVKRVIKRLWEKRYSHNLFITLLTLSLAVAENVPPKKSAES